MKITPDIINSEFIGTNTSIVESRHSGYVGISGEVINESKNTFTILQEGKMKNIIKEAATFRFRLSDGTVVEIDGKLLVGSPEARLKKNMKRLW
ncbi:ribonuclease P protein subunit [Candidatus Bathyarchaeota archaeon]|nr:ribonuclease P protein subunit [Candidatus Bathyarchaeota archaeon]